MTVMTMPFPPWQNKLLPSGAVACVFESNEVVFCVAVVVKFEMGKAPLSEPRSLRQRLQLDELELRHVAFLSKSLIRYIVDCLIVACGVLIFATISIALQTACVMRWFMMIGFDMMLMMLFWLSTKFMMVIVMIVGMLPNEVLDFMLVA